MKCPNCKCDLEEVAGRPVGASNMVSVTLNTAMKRLEDASRVRYPNMEYMMGYYCGTIHQLLAELPASHTIKFTERFNKHAATFFGEEK